VKILVNPYLSLKVKRKITLCENIENSSKTYFDSFNAALTLVSTLLMYKWLNRRSQRRSCNWRGFSEMLKYYFIPKPKIPGYW